MTDTGLRAHLGYEERNLPAPTVELRAADDTGEIWMTGIAATVEQPYIVKDWLGEFTETMAAGAFDKTVAEGDIRLLVDHERGLLARNRSGTLTLTADPHLRVDARLDRANPLAAEVESSLRRRDADAMSIGFQAVRQEWNEDYTVRRVIEARLFEVSILCMYPPANPATSATMRAIRRGPVDADDPDRIRAMIAQLSSLLPEDPIDRPANHADLEQMRERWTRLAPATYS